MKQFFALVARRPVVTVLVTLFVVLLVANYFLWQQRHTVTLQHEEVVRRGLEVAKALTDQARTKTDLTQLQDALAQIDRSLVVEGEMEVNLGYFYKIERLSRVRLSQLNQLSALPGPDGSPYRAVPFSMHVNGTYAQIMNFVHQLETGPRLVRIRTYSFVRSADVKSKNLDLDLTADLLAVQ
ncbi:MAG TPA: type 4a pilus biogenesis protein PilO [Candidatus Didemnitutus sp.]|nr:type 4a pilus biogenesis protein PilO [Candidatus Didemnitutus sp.]